MNDKTGFNPTEEENYDDLSDKDPEYEHYVEQGIKYFNQTTLHVIDSTHARYQEAIKLEQTYADKIQKLLKNQDKRKLEYYRRRLTISLLLMYDPIWGKYSPITQAVFDYHHKTLCKYCLLYFDLYQKQKTQDKTLDHEGRFLHIYSYFQNLDKHSGIKLSQEEITQKDKILKQIQLATKLSK